MLQFIPKGPQIPENVIQALNADSLVLFCGAGISMNNGLPSFKGLVETVCANWYIDIKENPLLKIAKERSDYAGIFDVLENDQISNLSTKPKILRKQVIKVLSDYKDQPEIHKALLELSALPDNKGHRLVTTNFDRLFFKANKGLKFDSAPKLIPPRKEKWRNLTFLHGVIDEDNDPESENLILTRTDFGLAYLHDNWASRFVIQLFQDFTVLFIGYSADDPVMSYLVSAISYESKRRKENRINDLKIKPFIYAFAGYERDQTKEVENKWKALGVEPILYNIKESDDHSLLYETIKEWAKLKKRGLVGRKNWLKRQLKEPYREETDKQKAETVISILKTDEKLAEYLPAINLSIDPKKRKPVDISWLKAFTEETKESKSNSFPSPKQTVKTKNSLLGKLTQQTAQSSKLFLWEPLSSTEKNIAEWLLRHLDKKELIHWLIKKSSHRSGLVSLHPEFKIMLKDQLEHIQKNVNEKLDERKSLFWKIVSTQKNQSQDIESFNLEILIKDLDINYSYEKATKFLSYLEPMIGFKMDPYIEFDIESNEIYKSKLLINTSEYPYEDLQSEKALLSHAEDFTNLLKKAMELAEFTGIIHEGHDLFCFQKPSIAPHKQNQNYNSWTYLIDLVRDSFDLAMQKNRKLAKLLIHKWQFYPYSIFYRLILYAVTKHPDLDEGIVIKLFEEKPDQTLWSISCQNEVLKFLRNRKHSEKSTEKLLSLIMKGPSRSLYRKDIKETAIYQRLNNLKISGVKLPKDIEGNYNKIQSKYPFKSSTEKDSDKEDFPVWNSEATWSGDEKRYHNKTCEEIFKEIKYTKPNTLSHPTNKQENFRSLSKDHPDKAYKTLLKFKESDKNSYSYWDVFISEIPTIKNTKESNDFYLKTLQKIEDFEDSFLKNYPWSLIQFLNKKDGLLYHKKQIIFKKWWNKLWDLSIKDKEDQFDSDISSIALNSKLGRLSQAIFRVLWSHFSYRKMKKNEKLPEEIKTYFKVIIKQGSLKDTFVLYHFGSYLWDLWFLDKEWVNTNLIELMNWNEKENLCKALWTGWLYHPKWSPDFLLDFKNEILQLILNREKLYKTNQQNVNKQGVCENIASIIFIASGGREIENIFTDKELKKLIQSMDVDILESLSRQMWQALEDSGNKSSNLWSEKIKPWIEKFWPPQTKLKNSQIAESLSLLILHCGNKLPEALNILKDKIEGVIDKKSYIAYYIIKNEKNEQQHKQDLEYIYNYPKELLQLLNWNFPKNEINQYMGGKEIKQILEKLKQKYLEIEKNSDYKKLSEKLL